MKRMLKKTSYIKQYEDLLKKSMKLKQSQENYIYISNCQSPISFNYRPFKSSSKKLKGIKTPKKKEIPNNLLMVSPINTQNNSLKQRESYKIIYVQKPIFHDRPVISPLRSCNSPIIISTDYVNFIKGQEVRARSVYPLVSNRKDASTFCTPKKIKALNIHIQSPEINS